jgi:hypothetical protein
VAVAVRLAAVVVVATGVALWSAWPALEDLRANWVLSATIQDALREQASPGEVRALTAQYRDPDVIGTIVPRALAASAVAIPALTVAWWVALASLLPRIVRSTPARARRYRGYVMLDGGEWSRFGRIGPIPFVQASPDVDPLAAPTLGLAVWRLARRERRNR